MILIISAARGGCYDERDFYHCPLRQRLPVIGIPLRSGEADAALDLQPLVDRCYQTGRYWQLSKRALLPPPLPKAEQDWLEKWVA
ncbi:MAG: DUF4058 family protein [Planctomycetota bacterium]